MAQTSLFLTKLPVEIRTKIYKELITDTRIGLEKVETSEQTWDSDTILAKQPLKPGLNNLALLKTCRQINEEIGNTWVNQARFWFTNVEAFIDVLVGGPKHMPYDLQDEIRYLRVDTYRPMLVEHVENEHYAFAAHLHYFLNDMQLQLEELTVVGSSKTDFVTLEYLIRYGIGWNKLKFFILEPEDRRDGNHPGASGDLFTRVHRPGAEWRDSRTNAVSIPALGDATPTPIGHNLSRLHRLREALVVVQRGGTVDTRKEPVSDQIQPDYESCHCGRLGCKVQAVLEDVTYQHMPDFFILHNPLDEMTSDVEKIDTYDNAYDYAYTWAGRWLKRLP